MAWKGLKNGRSAMPGASSNIRRGLSRNLNLVSKPCSMLLLEYAKEIKMTIKKKPLGYINLLNNKQKPIYPMDDFFLNYAFTKEENWQHLREIINIYLETYSTKYNRQDDFHFVGENIAVETQYRSLFETFIETANTRHKN
jgi:hypothetical protein